MARTDCPTPRGFCHVIDDLFRAVITDVLARLRRDRRRHRCRRLTWKEFRYYGNEILSGITEMCARVNEKLRLTV